MKKSLYDVLQVSANADPEIIQAAYERIKAKIQGQIDSGHAEARNELVFVEDAYATLRQPQKRQAYDANLAAQQASYQPVQAPVYGNSASLHSGPADLESSVFLAWWNSGLLAKLMVVAVLGGIAYGAYQYFGRQADNKARDRALDIVDTQVNGSLDNQRAQIDGSLRNQGTQINNNYDIARQEQDRRSRELEYRAQYTNQAMEMQRQQIEYARQQQEAARIKREADEVARREKSQLCNIYRSNGQHEMARSVGC